MSANGRKVIPAHFYFGKETNTLGLSDTIPKWLCGLLAVRTCIVEQKLFERQRLTLTATNNN
jgi:hypothetical protein